MDNITTYKIPRKPKQNLFPPPAYCRKYEKHQDKPPKHLCLEVSDPANILFLLESLKEGSSAALESTINLYLQNEIEAESVFIITFLPKTEEGIIKALPGQAFKSFVRRSVAKDTIEVIRARAEAEIDDNSINPEISKLITAVLKEIPDKLYTVAVVSKHQHEKLSMEPSPLLVCIANAAKDENVARKYVREAFRFCLPILFNTSAYEEEQRIKVQCHSILAIARKLFSSLGKLDDLLRDIMTEARTLTQSERCSLFLLDPDNVNLVARVFDGIATSSETQVVKIGKDQGIAGHVVATGKLLNIKDAYTHPLFYRGMDKSTGFITRNILCFPIRDENGIIGVAQLCNKFSGSFDCYDEEAAMALSIYCGLSIMHGMVYKKIQDAQKRSELSNELMMYHMKVNLKDISSIFLCPYLHNHPQFGKLTFSPREILESERVCYTLKMFTDLHFLEKFNIKRENLIRFILYVQRGYRDTPYHNWTHAFTVAYFAYVAIKNFQLIEKEYLTNLEALALMVSCLCHDIDHRGTTNSFQLQTGSTLASLYSSEGSVMERHHLSQTLLILNSKDCNFLESLDNICYRRVLDLLQENILATDLAVHLKIFPKMKTMVTEGYDPSNPEHKQMLQSMLMTCADLSDQTKNWKVTKHVAVYIYDEFFKQGDLEKKMGKTPLEMMDREKASIPELQIQFLNHVCLPIYMLLQELFPESEELVNNMNKNIQSWNISKTVFEQHVQDGKTSYDILKSVAFELDVEDKINQDECRAQYENQEEEEEEEDEEDALAVNNDY